MVQWLERMGNCLILQLLARIGAQVTGIDIAQRNLNETNICTRQPLCCPILQSLARMGAEVTGIDIAQRNVDIATAHAAQDPAIGTRTSYRAASAEQLVEEGASP